MDSATGGAVDLYGYALAIRGSAFPFDEGSALAPGETMTVFMQGSRSEDSRLERHLGAGGYLLPDAGGWVRLSAFNGVTLACDAWGAGAC